MLYITSIERLGRQEGRLEGRQEEAANLVVRQANKCFSGFSPADEAAIRGLSLEHLEELSEALLDFDGIENLRQWLRQSK